MTSTRTITTPRLSTSSARRATASSSPSRRTPTALNGAPTGPTRSPRSRPSRPPTAAGPAATSGRRSSPPSTWPSYSWTTPCCRFTNGDLSGERGRKPPDTVHQGAYAPRSPNLFHPEDETTLMSDQFSPKIGPPSDRAAATAAAATEDLRPEDLDAVRKLRDGFNDIKRQLSRVIVGQDQVIEELLIALFSRGHCILEGVPGPGQDVDDLARCRSRCRWPSAASSSRPTSCRPTSPARRSSRRTARPAPASSSSSRGRCSPTSFWPTKSTARRPRRRPRCWKPCRSARSPSAASATSSTIRSSCWPRRTRSSRKAPIRCPKPSRTASCSRSSCAIPKFDEEFEIARRTTALQTEESSPVLGGDQILDLQRLVRRVPVSDHVIRYTLALVRQTRLGEPGVPKFVRDWLSWGAGPRAVQYLILGGKARALLYGRVHVQTDDIQALAYPVLRAPHPDQLHRRVGRHHPRRGGQEADRGHAQQGERANARRAVQEDFRVVIVVEGLR